MFTKDAKNAEAKPKPDAAKAAGDEKPPTSEQQQSHAEGLPPIEGIYERGTAEIVAGRLALAIAVADVSKVYNLDPKKVKAAFVERVARAKPPAAAKADDSEAGQEKALAEKLVAEAVEAERFAAEAAEIAKTARLKADAALADAENRVLVSVPS